MKYTEEMKNFIINHYQNYTCKEISEMFNKKFETNKTPSMIKSFINNKKITKARKIRSKYTEEQINFLRENVKGISVKELTDRFNRKFNLKVSEEAISNLKYKYNLKNGITGGQFLKGHKPWNKGTKGLTHSNKTSFKKGNIPVNHKKIGYERINVDGYIEIKVKEPNVFKLKHRYLYEQKYGEIPKGYKLVFADGNKLNLEMDNLLLVSNSEQLIMNQNKLFKNNKELTRIGANIAKLIDKTNKRKRNL